jgi:hypothetical protein
MTGSGASFSVATTVFVSLAICAVISYGVFYYFKQRLSVIEQSQMEQARVMQSFIARSIMHQHGMNPVNLGPQFQEHPVHKEVNITESGLIEVSSESESDDGSETESTTSSDYNDDSGSSDSETEHDHAPKHAPKHAPDHETKCIQIQLLPDAVVADSVSAEKKIISLNKTALREASESESDNDDESSSDHEDPQDGSFELNIGYKKETNDVKKAHPQSMHLNYGNMSVPALRQLAKERGLGGEDGDLQKLKKKDLVQLLQ